MSFSYMRLYTGDYLRDTQHLSCSEHGIYLKLLMHCWDQKGPAPLDERKLIGICNARSSDEIEAMRRVLDEFFTRMDDGFYNKRMSEEIVSAEHYSENRSAAGRRSAELKRQKMRDHHLLNKGLTSVATSVEDMSVSPTPTPTLTPTPTPTPAPASTPKSKTPTAGAPSARGSRLPGDWVPGDEGIAFCHAERPDLDVTEVYQQFLDYWNSVPGAKGRKVDWMATWRNWVRNQRLPRPAGQKVA